MRPARQSATISGLCAVLLGLAACTSAAPPAPTAAPPRPTEAPKPAAPTAAAPAAAPTAPATKPPEAPAAKPAASALLTQLVEGARKETVLKGQWSEASFGGSAGLTEIVGSLNKKYGLNLQAQFTPGPNQQGMLEKLAQEAAAGRPASSDVYMGNSQAAQDAMKNKVLKPMDWPAILERPIPTEPGFEPIAPGGIAIAIATTVTGVTYNSSLVKGPDVPKRLEDVLNPKWKGKIASTPYADGLRDFAVKDVLGREFMIEFTKKLSKQIGGLMRCGETDRLTSGEFLMLVLDCGGDDALPEWGEGGP